MKLLQLTLCALGALYGLVKPVQAQSETSRTHVMLLEMASNGASKATLTSKAHLSVQSPSAERTGEETVISLPATLHLYQGDSVIVAAQAAVTVTELPSKTVSIQAKRMMITWSANTVEPTICVVP